MPKDNVISNHHNGTVCLLVSMTLFRIAGTDGVVRIFPHIFIRSSPPVTNATYSHHWWVWACNSGYWRALCLSMLAKIAHGS